LDHSTIGKGSHTPLVPLSRTSMMHRFKQLYERRTGLESLIHGHVELAPSFSILSNWSSVERAIRLKGLTVFASLTVLPYPEIIHSRQYTYIILDLLSRPAMSSIRISEDGTMRQHYADSHDAGPINDSTRRTSNRKPTPPKRYFTSWTEDGEPMSTKLGRNDSTLPSDNTQSKRQSPLTQCYSAWTEDGNPVIEKPEEDGSTPLRSNGGRSELPRRGRPRPWKVKITTAEVDENGKLERDVSMRWFPSGTGTEVKPSNAYVEMAIDFALKQERLFPGALQANNQERTLGSNDSTRRRTTT
jgi:hypothetical protein